MHSLDRGPGGWALHFDGPPEEAVIGEASRAVAAQGGGRLTVWVSDPTPATDAVAETSGLAFARDLLQLRRALPLALPRSSVSVRPFVPGVDEDAWLRVNNRAFAWHPEQGGWDRSVLLARETEPWFDPAGFLLHEEDGRLAAFCWTKVHDDQSPVLGEIYVIAVDPSFAGRGLGRELTLAGLDHLAARGITMGMLYVDATNVAARHLYDALGFTVHHVDRAYTTQAAPETPTTAPMP